MKNILKGLLYMIVTVFFIECNFNREGEITQPYQGEPLEAKTPITLTSLDTKMTSVITINTAQDTKITTLTNSLASATSQITTLKNSDATLTSAINTLSVANTAKDKTIAAQAVIIKNITDSLNLYKGALDFSLFVKNNGIVTLNITTLKSRLGLK